MNEESTPPPLVRGKVLEGAFRRRKLRRPLLARLGQPDHLRAEVLPGGDPVDIDTIFIVPIDIRSR